MSLPRQHVGLPSEETLAKVEAGLRALPRGTTRAVGGGVQMRLTADGRRSPHVRFRTGRGGGRRLRDDAGNRMSVPASAT